MKFLSCVSLKRVSLLALIPWLAACASGGAGIHADANARLDSGQPANALVVKQITPELVRSEREQHEQQTTQNISRLVSAVTRWRCRLGRAARVTLGPGFVSNGRLSISGPGRVSIGPGCNAWARAEANSPSQNKVPPSNRWASTRSAGSCAR